MSRNDFRLSARNEITVLVIIMNCLCKKLCKKCQHGYFYSFELRNDFKLHLKHDLFRINVQYMLRVDQAFVKA